MSAICYRIQNPICFLQYPVQHIFAGIYLIPAIGLMPLHCFAHRQGIDFQPVHNIHTPFTQPPPNVYTAFTYLPNNLYTVFTWIDIN